MICPLLDGELLEDNSCPEVIVVDTLCREKCMYVERKRKRQRKEGRLGEEKKRQREVRVEIIRGTTESGALPGLSRSNSLLSQNEPIQLGRVLTTFVLEVRKCK